jgi:ABC-2 type transport system ATP-binding protein
MTSSTPAIEVRDLRKSYGTNEAVRGISFRVEVGEVLAILGPNGAGKTTTVEILEGYRERTSGNVSVLGTDPASGGSALRQRVGIVLQSCGFDSFLSVHEMVQMYREYYPRPRDVDEVIELVGLTDKASSRVRSLSGGQQRRLDLALGLIGDPELLFLDEPTTGFDPSARRHAWEMVRALRTLGKTVLLTTHYMDEAQELADRIMIIAAGRVIAEGTPDTIGGRASARTLVRFSLPPSDPNQPPFVVTRSDDGTVSFETDDPTHDLHELTGWALDRGINLDRLSVTRPSLEDVYLQLTDHVPTGGPA